MNAATDKWIDVLLTNGKKGKMSLVECLRESENISELSGVTPIEKISIIRLLITCAQAALNGPNTRKELKLCKNDIPGKASEYVNKWENRFEIFGEFLQQKNIDPGKIEKVDGEEDEDEGNEEGERSADYSKLNFYKRCGNNGVYFDNNSENTPEELVKKILTYQNFSSSGLIAGPNAKWGNKKVGGKSVSSPCAYSLVTVIHGENLLNTIWLNMISKEDIPGMIWGKPVWEYELTGGNDENINEISMSYLGRMTPITKAISISSEKCSMIPGNMNFKYFHTFHFHPLNLSRWES